VRIRLAKEPRIPRLPDETRFRDAYGRRVNDQKEHLMPRIVPLLAAGLAALVAVAVLAASGAAQAPPSTLHLLAKADRKAEFFPRHRPRTGDRIVFGDRISGDETGIDRAACTVVGRGSLLCTIQVQLARGTLSAQGLVPQRSHGTPVAITGGTGAYDGASGTALVTDVSSTTSRIVVTLKP
jgi:hypothetical protein